MAKQFEVTWEGLLPATPDVVWDAFTRRTAGRLWEIAYEPRAGGAGRGLTGGGGTVTVGEPHRRFGTQAADDSGVNRLSYLLEPRDDGTYLRLGVRGADALYRFYGRDRWGWPVGVAIHRFGPGPDDGAWGSWLDDVHSTEAVA
jgi:hypothetical protein